MTLRRALDPIRSVVFNIAFYTGSLLYFLLVIGVVFIPGNKGIRLAIRGYCQLSMLFARWIMGIRYEWRGVDLPPEGQPVILAAAHQSYLDPMMAYRYREDVTALAKKELFSTPLVGPLLTKMRVIKVDRQQGGSADSMDDVAKALNAEGRIIIVYPQATRVRPGDRRRLKSGAYVLAKAGNIPVYTVATNAGALWSKGFWHHSGTCVFEICRRLPADMDKTDFMTALENDIVHRSEVLTAESGFADVVKETQALAAAKAQAQTQAAQAEAAAMRANQSTDRAAK